MREGDKTVGEPTIITKSFGPGLGLRAEGLDADLIVGTHDGADIQVRIEGPEKRARCVIAEKRGDMLYLSEPEPKGGVRVSGDVTVITGGHVGSISVGRGGRVIVNGKDVTAEVNAAKEPPTTIRVLVPVGSATPVDIDVRGAGEVTIGDLFGTLKVRASGNAAVRVGAMTRTTIRASGCAAVTQREANGDVKVDASGTANIDISGGDAATLEVEASGTAFVGFDGSAVDADLEASGCAKVVVGHVRNRPRQRTSGVSSIRVRRHG